MSAPPRCSSGKRRFPTERAAADRLTAILDAPLTDHPYPVVGYWACSSCRGFHLTSKITKPKGRGKSSRNPHTKGRRR